MNGLDGKEKEHSVKNVAVLTTERCGCSWMAAIISEVHRQFYGKPIFWDFECSRVMAIDKEYTLPKGYISVYYVKLSWLLEREYDKIIVLQREWKPFLEAVIRYHRPQWIKNKIIKWIHRKELKEWIKRIRFYYDLVFSEEIEDPRVLYVNLSDLNNFPIEEFSRILDFLEYPRENRPVLLPIRIPERDWDIQGTVINKGHGFDHYQIGMIKYTGVKGEIPIVDPNIHINPDANIHGYIKSKSQYVNYEYPNPYKVSKEEWKATNGQVFRLRPEPMVDVLKILGWITDDNK